MSKLLWLSDIHLDAADGEVRQVFIKGLQSTECQALIVTGDTADGLLALQYVKEIAAAVSKPIYFVLGNHDFYGLSIDIQKKRALELTSGTLYYLTKNGPVLLNDTWALTGHDGWADASIGNFDLSIVGLRDYIEIMDFKWLLRPRELQDKLQELGKEAAEEARLKLEQAFQLRDKVLFVTHAPPFREVCLYDEQETDDAWAPHFVGFHMGEMLREVMAAHPEKECLVLCGHTHHKAQKKILPNLEVRVAFADYGAPRSELLNLA